MAKLVLIAGASTGIGFELCRIFARNGFNVALVAKNKERLEKAEEKLRAEYKVETYSFVADLATAEGPELLYQSVKEAGLRVDVLVNNAGFGFHGLFLETDLKHELQMMQLNMITPVQLTKLYLKEMKGRGEGKILQVASTAAFQPGPTMAIYYATKAFLLFFSEAIRDELRGSGITVTALCPGATESNFAKSAKMEGTHLFQRFVMDAATVAEAGYRGLMAGKSVVIPGFKNKLLAASVRFIPRDLVTVFSRKAVETA